MGEITREQADRRPRRYHPLIGTVYDGTEGIYVGRLQRGIFGNPFVIPRDGDRATVIAKYRRWLKEQIRADGDTWIPRLAALHEERLLCHCAPEPCHAEVLIDAAAWAYEEIGATG